MLLNAQFQTCETLLKHVRKRLVRRILLAPYFQRQAHNSYTSHSNHAQGGSPLRMAPDLTKSSKQGLFLFFIEGLLACAQRFAGAQQTIDGSHLVVGVVRKTPNKDITRGVQRVLVW